MVIPLGLVGLSPSWLSTLVSPMFFTLSVAALLAFAALVTFVALVAHFQDAGTLFSLVAGG